tara:strand:- start:147 stop:455 length:309 start_codon:yes stop_codon:yes gene_type:complete
VRILKTEKEYTEALMEQQPMPASVMKTGGYFDLSFECGCGKSHGVNDLAVEQIASFRPVKILFKCKTHYTKVRIKGIFKQTCISEWTCKNTLVSNLAKKIGL